VMMKHVLEATAPISTNSSNDRISPQAIDLRIKKFCYI
jgi:hypothetical protein